MDTLVKELDYKGYTIEVHYDTDPLNPRECDQIGIFCTTDWTNETHLNAKDIARGEPIFILGEEFDPEARRSPEEIFERYEESEVIAILPVYKLDHSGVWYKTSSFECPWDSGQIGWIYATDKSAKALCGDNYDLDNIRQQLIYEVKEISAYASGEVYGYVILDEDGEHVDSCWGYYGEYDYPISEAKSIIDHIVNRVMTASETRAPVMELLE